MTQTKILLIGCGAIGSYLTKNVLRTFQVNNKPVHVHVVDFDVIEERNVFSQDFTPEDIGKLKVEATYEKNKEYSGDLTCSTHKVDHDNLGEIWNEFGPFDFVVLSIDSYIYRIRITNAIIDTYGVPVLNSAINTNYEGEVGWTIKSKTSGETITAWDNHPNNFVDTPGQIFKMIERSADHTSPPPCELVAFTELITCAAFTTAKALLAACGTDMFKEIPDYFLSKGKTQEEVEAIPTDTTGFLPSYSIVNTTSTVKAVQHESQ